MSDCEYYVSTSAQGITEEIEIPVPWGIVSGKTYGGPTNPPVLCIHGWLDNCNTFDKLIPLLPKDKFYFFIDLPGHGHSSAISLGFFYAMYYYVAVINRIVEHFKWQTLSFLSHSLGGAISTYYAGIFPDKVDKLILLDMIGIPLNIRSQPELLRSSIENYANYEQNNKPLSSYSYEVAKQRLLKANRSLTTEAAEIILERGSVQLNDGTFYFTRDFRHKFNPPARIDGMKGIDITSNIRAETIQIIAKYGVYYQQSKERQTLFNYVMEHGFKTCQLHKYVEVEGKHHVHLTDPENVINIVRWALNRPPRFGIINPKTPTSQL